MRRKIEKKRYKTERGRGRASDSSTKDMGSVRERHGIGPPKEARSIGIGQVYESGKTEAQRRSRESSRGEKRE